MTKFRPCIDLHAGSVKQIVGGTLSTSTPSDLKTNWTSEHPSAYYASLYKQHELAGAHVIMLGPGNEAAAQEALEAWKGGMQVGGGITEANAREWIERGAEKVRKHTHRRLELGSQGLNGAVKREGGELIGRSRSS